MNNAEFMLTQLAALRHQLLGAAGAIEVILEHASRPSDAEVEESGTKQPPVCKHPMSKRHPTPVMGHPHRFRCTACGQEVEGP